VSQWLASVPADRREAIDAVRAVVNEHLPRGYEETVDWGMLAWVVPGATLPDTYNGRPLLLAALGAHTKRMTLYLMTVYGDPTIRREFEEGYRRAGKKLDMGGSCVHFRTLDHLPLDVVAETIARVPVDAFIEHYHRSRPKRAAKAKSGAKPVAKSGAKSSAKPAAKNAAKRTRH
jgi:hypothetical protein